MQLADFKAKNVPGLYNYDHFEHESGAFIQLRVDGTNRVYQDSTGSRHDNLTWEGLKTLVAADNPT